MGRFGACLLLLCEIGIDHIGAQDVAAEDCIQRFAELTLKSGLHRLPDPFAGDGQQEGVADQLIALWHGAADIGQLETVDVMTVTQLALYLLPFLQDIEL